MKIETCCVINSVANVTPKISPRNLLRSPVSIRNAIQFILPLGNPSTEGDKSSVYDDFTCEACAWTLTAHEGRPGHELQFSAMVEHGVSLARSLFAFNSVNVEGWALYAEFMMVPYEPPAGQFVTLQLRLMRAARAFLDPMLNLGLISKERAHDVLRYDVGLSGSGRR